MLIFTILHQISAEVMKNRFRRQRFDWKMTKAMPMMAKVQLFSMILSENKFSSQKRTLDKNQWYFRYIYMRIGHLTKQTKNSHTLKFSICCV